MEYWEGGSRPSNKEPQLVRPVGALSQSWQYAILLEDLPHYDEDLEQFVFTARACIQLPDDLGILQDSTVTVTVTDFAGYYGVSIDHALTAGTLIRIEQYRYNGNKAWHIIFFPFSE
jgi:hypothetical protein